MSDEKTNVIDPNNGKTPGKLLRAAREAKGLTIAQVAKILPLSKRQLEDIESDNYSDITALIYMRGRLGLYARYIDTSVDEVLQAFDELGIGESVKAPAQRVQSSSIASDHHSSSSVRWLSYGVGFVLLILVLIWWRNHSGEAYKSSTPPSVKSTSTSTNSAPAVENNNGSVPLMIPATTNAPAANTMVPAVAAPVPQPQPQPAVTPNNDRPPQGIDTRIE